MTGTCQPRKYALSLLKETYHILLYSITIMILYVKEIFENWIRIVNKNQNTKLSKQTDKKIAGDSTTMKNEVDLGLGG
jgi:hypothetical protein